MSITSGGDYPLMSSCREECCNRIFGAMKVRHDPTGDEQTLGEFRHPSGPDKCMLLTRFVLVLKKDASKEEMSAHRAKGVPLLEIVAR